MGYMSLDTWGDSDFAADAYYRMIRGMIKVLNESLTEKTNEFNTCGAVNVALIIESGIFDTVPAFMLKGFNFVVLSNNLWEKVESAGEDKKAVWNDEANRIKHHVAYKRLYDCVVRLYKRYQAS